MWKIDCLCDTIVAGGDIMLSYKNKKFSILGDSISTFEGYSEPYDACFYESLLKCQTDILRVSDTWWGQVIEHLGGELLVNNSFSGSLASKHPNCEIESYGCSNERTSSLSKNSVSPDVIMVFIGTNDWGHGVKLRPESGAEENDESVFLVAYDTMLKKLKANYPNAEIWCITLPVSNYRKIYNKDFPYSFGGVHIEKYCNIIFECAEENGCKVIDLYNSGIKHDTIDGFHPNAKGMKAISKAIISILSN